jgi:hypothetical protein
MCLLLVVAGEEFLVLPGGFFRIAGDFRGIERVTKQVLQVGLTGVNVGNRKREGQRNQPGTADEVSASLIKSVHVCDDFYEAVQEKPLKH